LAWRHLAFPYAVAFTLADLPPGQSGVLAGFDLSADDAGRLMELGFLPGAWVRAVRAAPGGDPRVFRVDGAEVALRRETARLVILRDSPP
jgi:ferrous iron transport protein A